jgi:FkbM family methyltransferase
MINLGNYFVPQEVLNGICFDIGSNFGDFTNKYLNKFSKIYFIEPQINLFNKILNRFAKYSHVKGLNKAVWSESDILLDMVSHINTDYGSVGVKSEFLNKDWTNDIVNKVESICIDGIYKINNYKNIDYMKLDCETSEYSFLYNKDLSKIKYIGMELHWQLGIERYEQLINYIKRSHSLIYGDDSFRIESNKEVLYKIR